MKQDYIYMEETTVKSSSEVRNVYIRIRSVVEGVEKMLLHRVGAITCDMLFDPLTATMVDYKAYMVGAKFLLHTETYSIEEN